MNERENIAETLARELPEAAILSALSATMEGPPSALLAAVPTNHKLETIDLEKYSPTPRRTDGSASFSEPDSFLQYVLRHQKPDTSVVWCSFDPKTFKLSFTAVFDDHAANVPGWRKHRATYTPAPSIEWGTWTGSNGQSKAMSQFDFAVFLENNYQDITGTPTSADMLQMATQFEAREDQALKSAVRLQSGGVELSYISNDDAQTIERMKMFDEFHLGIPVFWGSSNAELLKAKLRYRTAQGKVSFWYELQRPDKAHEQAARDMIQRIRDGIGGLPLLMGNL